MNLFDIEDSLTSFFFYPLMKIILVIIFWNVLVIPKPPLKRLKSGETNYSKLKNSILQKIKYIYFVLEIVT